MDRKARKFEKISFEQFKKDVKDDIGLYNNYCLPKRSTRYSAGYDFFALEDITIKPKEIVKIPTGYKAELHENEVLLIIVRSSTGYKYNVRMCNQVGVVESDYYNNESNEGHIWIALQNEGNEVFTLARNKGYVQGIFTSFLLTDDDEVKEIRKGGIGSTTKEG